MPTVEVGAQRAQEYARAARGRPRRASRSRNLDRSASTADSEQPPRAGRSRPRAGRRDRRDRLPVRRPRRGCARAPHRDASRGAEQDLAPARAARQRARPSAGSTPARSSEDLPIPDGPRMPTSGHSASRATSSEISRSRPQKNSASELSNAARPLNGHRTGRSGAGRLDLGAVELELRGRGAGSCLRAP